MEIITLGKNEFYLQSPSYRHNSVKANTTDLNLGRPIAYRCISSCLSKHIPANIEIKRIHTNSIVVKK